MRLVFLAILALAALAVCVIGIQLIERQNKTIAEQRLTIRKQKEDIGSLAADNAHLRVAVSSAEFKVADLEKELALEKESHKRRRRDVGDAP